MDVEDFVEDLAKRHTYVDTYGFYLSVTNALRARSDAVNDLRQFAALRARREAQWYRWPELRTLLAFATTCHMDGLRYVYRDFDIGWLHRERRRWQRKQR